MEEFFIELFGEELRPKKNIKITNTKTTKTIKFEEGCYDVIIDVINNSVYGFRYGYLDKDFGEFIFVDGENWKNNVDKDDIIWDDTLPNEFLVKGKYYINEDDYSGFEFDKMELNEKEMLKILRDFARKYCHVNVNEKLNKFDLLEIIQKSVVFNKV